MKNIKSLISLLIILIITTFLFSTPVFANQKQASGEVTIYFFWGDGCPHCAEEEIFLDELVQKYPQVQIQDYEVWYDKANQEIFNKVAEVMGFEVKGVPVTIIGEKVWVGFREQYKAEMEAAIKACFENICPSPIESEVLSNPQESEVQKDSAQIITLPLIGDVDLGQQSLAISTLIIGFVDGFNPCSLWVISVLLTLALTSRSRAKVITVGLTFLVVSAIIYSMFILGVFTLFSYIGYLKWIQVIVALVALGFGFVNMKDYFWYKKGLSFSIPEKQKPGLYKNMRDSVVTPRSMLGLIGSTAVMAAGVSLIEFSCTAGFPVIWSNIMVANKVGPLYFALLLGLYMLIYLIDEIALFSAAAVSMKAFRFEEKHGRLLKLAGGVIMLVLGIVMLIDPAIMNNINSSFIVFTIAVALIALIFFMHQKVLPKMGILIGSGFNSSKRKKRH